MTHEQVKTVIEWLDNEGHLVISGAINQLTVAFLEVHPEEAENFFCADWDRCGAICEEQCPACHKAENMPTIIPDQPTLRERAEKFLKMFYRDENSTLHDGVVDAMLQFAAEVGEEKDKRIAKMEAEVKRLRDPEAHGKI